MCRVDGVAGSRRAFASRSSVARVVAVVERASLHDRASRESPRHTARETPPSSAPPLVGSRHGRRRRTRRLARELPSPPPQNTHRRRLTRLVLVFRLPSRVLSGTGSTR
jgi:hypothetical protein